jgi:hypothetical protein
LGHSHKLAAYRNQRTGERRANGSEQERERKFGPAPLKFVYNADKILRKRLFVAKPMTLTRSAKVSDEINDLDDVIHHLFPHLLIKVDFLKKYQLITLGGEREREKNARS